MEARRHQAIEKEVLRIVCMVMELKKKQIQKTSMLEDLGVTSLEFLSIVSAIEWWTNIKFASEDLTKDKFMCVNDFIVYVEKKKEEK